MPHHRIIGLSGVKPAPEAALGGLRQGGELLSLGAVTLMKARIANRSKDLGRPRRAAAHARASWSIKPLYTEAADSVSAGWAGLRGQVLSDMFSGHVARAQRLAREHRPPGRPRSSRRLVLPVEPGVTVLHEPEQLCF
jgi:hypothetical protein